MSIIENHNWINPNIMYIRDKYIHEWDIQAAGFSALKENNYLSPTEISRLENMNKMDRNIQIGLMQKKDPKMIQMVLDTIKSVRQEFYIANGLHDSKILSIKKDAIIIVDSPVKKTEFGRYFKFINKGSFTSFVRIGNYEMYLNPYGSSLVVKGMGEEYDEVSILALIKDTLKKCETYSKDERFKYLKKIQNDYLTFQCPIYYYKDPITSQYTLDGYDFTTPDPSAFAKEQLEISTNYQKFLLPLIQAVI